MTTDHSATPKKDRLRKTVGRLWRARRDYAYSSDWLLSFYHRLLLKLPKLPLPGRNTTRCVQLRALREPLHVRLGTTDWYVMEEVFVDGTYEPLIQRGLRNVRQILDLGANAGFTIRLWQILYPGAQIVAVEPDAANLKMCSYNALKNTQRLKLVRACAAGTARTVSLNRSGGAWRFSMREYDDRSAEGLPAITVPKILGMCAIDGPIDLLKCDIEGSEAELFADCGSWISGIRNLIVELHPPYSLEKFSEDLRRAGGQFQVYHQVSSNKSELLFLEQTANSSSE